MSQKIRLKCWNTVTREEHEFEAEPGQEWKYLCLDCYKKYYAPVRHLITLNELKNDLPNENHILFNHPKTKRVTCIHTDEVFEVPIECDYFMTEDAMNNTFYPLLNKYGRENYSMLRKYWHKTLEFEALIKELMSVDTRLVFMLCKGIYSDLLNKMKMTL